MTISLYYNMNKQNNYVEARKDYSQGFDRCQQNLESGQEQPWHSCIITTLIDH